MDRWTQTDNSTDWVTVGLRLVWNTHSFATLYTIDNKSLVLLAFSWRARQVHGDTTHVTLHKEPLTCSLRKWQHLTQISSSIQVRWEERDDYFDTLDWSRMLSHDIVSLVQWRKLWVLQRSSARIQWGALWLHWLGCIKSQHSASVDHLFLIISLLCSFLGDTPPHSAWEESYDSQLGCTKILIDSFNKTLSNYNIYPTIGNHGERWRSFIFHY